MTGLNYVWVLMPLGLDCLGSCAFLRRHCDTFCLPFSCIFHVILPSPVSPAVPSMPFTLCLCLSSALEHPGPLSCPFPLAPQNRSTGLVKLMSKTQGVSVAVPGSVHVVSMTCEVGSVISCIPRAGKHLPTAYNFASLQAINAKSLVSFLHIKAKSMLRAAGCFCSNTKCGFSG